MSDLPNSVPPADADRDADPATGAELLREERTLAMLAHLLGIVSWIIGPLVIWRMEREASAFVDQQARESLNFQITLGIGYVVAGVLACGTLGVASVISLMLWIFGLASCLVAAAAARSGRRFRYPIAIRPVRASHP